MIIARGAIRVSSGRAAPAAGAARRRVDIDERVDDPVEVRASGGRRHGAHGLPVIDDADPVAGAQVVLGDRRGGVHRGVERAADARGSAPGTRSVELSTTSITVASRSVSVAVTCRVWVRNDTGQLIRLSRSPTWNGRMPARSVPSPGRRERCVPDDAAGDRQRVPDREPLAVGHDLDRPPQRVGLAVNSPVPPQAVTRAVPTDARDQRRAETGNSVIPVRPSAGAATTASAVPRCCRATRRRRS